MHKKYCVTLKPTQSDEFGYYIDDAFVEKAMSRIAESDDVTNHAICAIIISEFLTEYQQSREEVVNDYNQSQ